MIVAGGFARFQDTFVDALVAPPQADTSHSLAAMPGFLIYRNTVLKGCIDALQANFPAVVRLVGEVWFRAAAAVYARQDPPRVPMLLEYGAGFADFLARFEPAAELPYLPAVARLDRFWSESHAAADDIPLRAQDLAGLAQEILGRMVLKPHAAARWAWLPVPAFTIWTRNRGESPAAGDEPEFAWHGEGALLTRPRDAIEWLELDQAACMFMDACAAGVPLAEAAGCVPAADIAGLLARLLEAGAFTIGEQE